MQRWTATRERYDPERGDEYVFCELDESDNGDYVRFDDASAEVTRLVDQLAEAETTIGQLKHLIGEQTDRIRELESTLENVRAELRHSDLCLRNQAARAEKAEGLAVWAVHRHAYSTASIPQGEPRRVNYSIGWRGENYCLRHALYDGTDADILRALREARGTRDAD